MSTNTTFKRISLLGWCLFDFANSIPAVIGGIYFSKWFINDLGTNSILFNLLFFFSALVVAITGKKIGKKIDTNSYKPWIIISSVAIFLSLLFLFLFSQIFSNTLLITLSFIFFSFFIFAYQIGRITHNSYLRKIIPEELQSKYSGLGASANWVGSIIGIIITIPIISNYSGAFGRELTFLVASIAYAILTPIALFFMFKSKTETEYDKKNIDFTENNKILNWRFILPKIGLSLIVYFILFDVMATVERNLPPYLTEIFQMPDDKQAIGFLIILFSASIGGIIAAKFIKTNNSKIWLRISTSSLMISIILITLTNSILLWIAFCLAGISYGVLESTIRVNFMSFFTKKNAGESFGVLAIVERTSGIVGPVIWVIPFAISKNIQNSYYAGMIIMAGLCFFSLCLTLLQKQNK